MQFRGKLIRFDHFLVGVFVQRFAIRSGPTDFCSRMGIDATFHKYLVAIVQRHFVRPIDDRWRI